jgi:hypothetical protein
MKTDAFEAELRQALARRAAEVPPAAARRLRHRDYRPRHHNRAGVAAAGLVSAALAASGGAYLAGMTAGGAGHAHRSAGTPRLAHATVTLAGYRFTLPAGFKTTAAPCAVHVRGLHGAPAPGSRWFAAGAAAHLGCVEAVLTAATLTPPPEATPVHIGRYQGYLLDTPQPITLYVRLPAAGHHRWLVIAAKHLSAAEVSQMAARALGQPIGNARK